MRGSCKHFALSALVLDRSRMSNASCARADYEGFGLFHARSQDTGRGVHALAGEPEPER